MGVCGSKPEGCVGMNGKLKLQKKRKKQRTRRLKKSHPSAHKNRVEPSNQSDLPFSNPAFQGNSESWFDPDVMIESDGDDEFYSIQDDISQAGSMSNVVTPRFSNQVMQSNNTDFQLSSDDPQNEVDENGLRDEMGTLHNCGFLSNALLPCLVCDESLDGKRKSPSQGGLSTKKRVSLAPSFKWREGQEKENPILSSTKPVIQRPIAGSLIRCSPLEKKMSECWSPIEPSTFKVRGQNYNRDKKKELASGYAAYVPFGVDVFLSPRKVDHVARFVELPAFDSSGEVPPILVVNLQIPFYPATIFQNDYDGPGVSYVFYFKLSESYTEDLPAHFQENFRRIIANETEKIKSFPLDTNASFRERLKILGRVVNVEDLQLSGAERKLMHAYNEKPVLSRPQHEFYLGENYLEIDLDIHRFSYIARKGFETFQDRIKHCIFDFGLTIQGNKAEDLPECMLCCIRLKEIDYTNYPQLNF
ncbi:hypothetical protein BUALT_Bualt04G0150800 [Buddleja alternifolia]|uniref:Protein ENHANCED DISEASE RESISTANCE 2 C-terminal domain-containing protein n=1 Tax=Buddleja alternifolia TaxID=168488 RepID=A0AAV6XP38_9LAMI|nr:hypothetical protein BUALT_Bualt04G0150800 [Buddleja alternifolia]